MFDAVTRVKDESQRLDEAEYDDRAVLRRDGEKKTRTLGTVIK